MQSLRIAIVSLVLLAALVQATVQPPVLRARFIGQMAFAITDGSVTLVTDFPYRIGYVDAPAYAPAELSAGTASTLALVTHRHPDHWEPSLFLKTAWRVAGPADVTAGLPAERVLALQGPTSFGPVRIDPIATPHARIGHYSYIVRWHGKRLYFSGDTAEPRSVVEAKNLDAAFVSPWLFATIRRQGARIDAKRTVIYHHAEGDRIPGCEPELPSERRAPSAEQCTVPRQGDTIEFR